MNDIFEELPNVPTSWIKVKISDVGLVVSGGTPSTKNEEYFNGDIPWITPADLTNYKNKLISKGKRNISEDGLKNSSAQLVPSGSILFSSRAPIGYVAIAANDIATNQGFKNLIPSTQVFNEYIYYYLLSSKQIAESFASGTTFKEISGTSFGKLPIVLPPLPEQHRIVAKLEELFTKLDVSVAELKKAKAQIKRYRQSVLKHAFDGKLTEQWRKQTSNVKGEKAEELLVKIKEERKKALGKKYKELPPVDTTNLPQLPDGWVWTNVESVTQNFDGNRVPVSSEKRKSIQGKYPYYGATWIIDYVNDYLFDGKYILIGEDGANLLSKNRRLAFRVTGKIWVNNHAHIVKTYANVSMGYFEYYFNSIRIEDYVTGTAQPKLTQMNMNKIPFPICNDKEQEIIVSEIERHFSVADETEKIIDQSLKQAERLRQSILKDAFSGKLVPQDPSDPPASLLLEKIKAEKEKLAKEPKTEKSDKRTGREVAGEDKAERAKVNSSKRKTMGTR